MTTMPRRRDRANVMVFLVCYWPFSVFTLQPFEQKLPICSPIFVGEIIFKS
jgi:hypothetical protein